MAIDRLQISLRLKAARHLAGGPNERGKPVPMPVEELARHPRLRDNGITANRLEEFEQLKAEARPMELREIRAALGLPQNWFEAEDAAELGAAEAAVERRLDLMTDAITRLAAALPTPAPGDELLRMPEETGTTTEGDAPLRSVPARGSARGSRR